MVKQKLKIMSGPNSHCRPSVEADRDKNFLKSDLWSIENENLTQGQKLKMN